MPQYRAGRYGYPTLLLTDASVATQSPEDLAFAIEVAQALNADIEQGAAQPEGQTDGDR